MLSLSNFCGNAMLRLFEALGVSGNSQVNPEPPEQKLHQDQWMSLGTDDVIQRRYRDFRRIGKEGATSLVYVATDSRTGSPVVIKRRDPDSRWPVSVFTKEYAFLLLRQGEQAAPVVHGLGTWMTVNELGMVETQPAIVMEYFPLGTLPKCRHLITPDNLESIIWQLVSAVIPIHEKGIVCREIKPDNILIRQSSKDQLELVLADHGISQLEGDPRDIGIPSKAYCPPDPLGKQFATNDVWQIGAVLFEIITKTPLWQLHQWFAHSSPIPSDHEHYQDPCTYLLESPNLSETWRNALESLRYLDPIIKKALRENPRDRYSNAQEMMDAMRLAKSQVT